jgi:hypothetical protein
MINAYVEAIIVDYHQIMLKANVLVSNADTYIEARTFVLRTFSDYRINENIPVLDMVSKEEKNQFAFTLIRRN